MIKIIGILFVFISSAISNAQELPVIKRSGVLPVEWVNSNQLSIQEKEKARYISQNFRNIVYSSKRFRFANEEIVDLYAFSKTGRETLKKQYEVNSLIGLNAEVKNDLIEFEVFLSSLYLDLYLSETARLSLNWVQNSSDEELKDKITQLTYSMLNRYPADVFVNSIQGKYIVLSSGLEQNLKNGDSLDFLKIEIAQTNPANGTWLKYSKSKLGSATIIDSKKYTSIAEITSQISPDAIKVGSAARIKDIPTREKFAQANISTEYQDSEPEIIEIEPNYSEEKSIT